MIDNDKNSDPILATIGNNIRLLRHQRGLTQHDMAKLLGVSFQQIQKYENGTNRMRLEHILFLKNHFGIGYERIFSKHSIMPAALAPADTDLQKTLERIIISLHTIRDPALLKKIHKIINIIKP